MASNRRADSLRKLIENRGDASAQDHRLVFKDDSGREAVLDYSGADGGSAP